MVSINVVQAQNACEKRLETLWQENWGQAESVAIVFENLGDEEPQLPYLKFFLNMAGSEEKGYGSDGNILYRRFGTLIAQCFVAIGDTATKPRQMADAFCKVFEGRNFNGVTCREGDVNTVGETDDGLYQVNARVYFDFDETRKVF